METYDRHTTSFRFISGSGINELVIRLPWSEIRKELELNGNDWMAIRGSRQPSVHCQKDDFPPFLVVLHDLGKNPPPEFADDDIIVQVIVDTRLSPPSFAARNELPKVQTIYLGEYLQLAPRPAADKARSKPAADVKPRLEEQLSHSLPLDLELLPLHEPIKLALAVDLGNTRTYGLLVDDLGGLQRHKEPQLKPLRISHRDKPLAPPQTGVFDSELVLRDADRFAYRRQKSGSWPDRFGEPLSMVDLGSYATEVKSSTGKHPPDLIGLSSPKRYFWDCDPQPNTWFMHRQSHDGKPNQFLPLASRLERPIRKRLNGDCPIAYSPRCTMLIAMIVELLERADEQANNSSHWHGESPPRVRRIDTLAVSYPTAWLQAERIRYRQIIQDAADIYASERALPPIRVNVDCDEASAVLVTYLQSDLETCGLDVFEWLRTRGKLWNATGSCRIRTAVIDIGGGTSDLMIADLQQGGTRNSLEIGRLYMDGAPHGGDELARDLIVLLLEEILPEICGLPDVPTEKPTGKQDLADYQDKVADRKHWTDMMRSIYGPSQPMGRDFVYSQVRQLFLPMVLRILEYIGSTPALPPDSSLIVPLNLEHQEGFRGQRRRFAAAVDRWRTDRNVSFTLPPSMGNEERWKRIVLTPALREKLVRLCRDIFYDRVCQRFAAAIGAFDCDLVVYAGRTTDLPPIRGLLLEAIPMPEWQIVPLRGRRIGPWFPGTNASSTHIEDTKTTTAVGTALYLLTLPDSRQQFGHDTPTITLRNAAGYDDERVYWGIISLKTLRFGNSPDSILFEPDAPLDHQAEIPITSVRPIFIGWRRVEHPQVEAIPAYELRYRQKSSDQRVDSFQNAFACIRRRQLSSNPGRAFELYLATVSGRVDDRPLTLDDFDLRPRMMISDQFWHDSAQVYAN